MIFLHTFLFVVALISSMQAILSEYRLQLKADAFYKRRAYSQAEAAFRQLVVVAPEQKERAAAGFNMACALYMQGKYAEAATRFAYNKTPDSKLSEIRLKTIFNEGNTLAMSAIGSSAKTQKKALFRQSLNCFKTVLLTDPGDGDAKINYEVVRRYLDELERSEHASSTHQQASGVAHNVADRLLEHAQQDEFSLMRRLQGSERSALQGSKSNQDW